MYMFKGTSGQVTSRQLYLPAPSARETFGGNAPAQHTKKVHLEKRESNGPMHGGARDTLEIPSNEAHPTGGAYGSGPMPVHWQQKCLPSLVNGAVLPRKRITKMNGRRLRIHNSSTFGLLLFLHLFGVACK